MVLKRWKAKNWKIIMAKNLQMKFYYKTMIYIIFIFINRVNDFTWDVWPGYPFNHRRIKSDEKNLLWIDFD